MWTSEKQESFRALSLVAVKEEGVKRLKFSQVSEKKEGNKVFVEVQLPRARANDCVTDGPDGGRIKRHEQIILLSGNQKWYSILVRWNFDPDC